MNFVDLNKYQSLRQIGKGGYGIVYEIEEIETGQKFAAKVSIDEVDDSSEELLDSLSNEIDIFSKLNHPSIIKFIGFSPYDFNDQLFPVIVTEYADNSSLDNVLKLVRKDPSRIFWNNTKKLINIYGIASAMSYLHSHGIIHRDLNPKNILMDEYLFPKIADFGLSLFYNKNQEENEDSQEPIKGTFRYWAPEIFESKEYEKPCDVYSFALIVYEIMTKIQPFLNMEYYNVCYDIAFLGNRPGIPENVPKAYKNLIESCWTSNPFDRPTFADIVEDLKNNPEFICEGVNETDFFDYVKYIDQYHTTFDPRKGIIKLEDIIFGRKTDAFKKISLSDEINSKSHDDDETKEEEDEVNETSKIKVKKLLNCKCFNDFQ